MRIILRRGASHAEWGREFFETRMTMNEHEFFMNKFMDNSWVFVGIYVKRKANLTNVVMDEDEVNDSRIIRPNGELRGLSARLPHERVFIVFSKKMPTLTIFRTTSCHRAP
jgi:hypothetical protein